MKVYVQVVDTRTGISQYGCIEESIKKGFEIPNALEHFGVNISTVEWLFEHQNGHIVKCGTVKNTTKIVNIICVG